MSVDDHAKRCAAELRQLTLEELELAKLGRQRPGFVGRLRIKLSLGDLHDMPDLTQLRTKARAPRHPSDQKRTGDPGTGKTTLLRYLALRHAQALLNDAEANIRTASYAARTC